MKCPPTTFLFENVGGSFIGQSSPTRVRALVSPGGDDVRSPVGKEHRSLPATG